MFDVARTPLHGLSFRVMISPAHWFFRSRSRTAILADYPVYLANY